MSYVTKIFQILQMDHSVIIFISHATHSYIGAARIIYNFFQDGDLLAYSFDVFVASPLTLARKLCSEVK